MCFAVSLRNSHSTWHFYILIYSSEQKACGSLTNLLKVRGMGDERSASPLGTDAEGGGAAAAGASNELDSLQ